MSTLSVLKESKDKLYLQSSSHTFAKFICKFVIKDLLGHVFNPFTQLKKPDLAFVPNIFICGKMAA